MPTLITNMLFLQIVKIQNPWQYQKYAVALKAAMARLKWPQDKVERKLWHGTKEEAVEKITHGMFNRSFSGDAHGEYLCNINRAILYNYLRQVNYNSNILCEHLTISNVTMVDLVTFYDKLQ